MLRGAMKIKVRESKNSNDVQYHILDGIVNRIVDMSPKKE